MEENIKLQREMELNEEDVQTTFNEDELWLNVSDGSEEVE